MQRHVRQVRGKRHPERQAGPGQRPPAQRAGSMRRTGRVCGARFCEHHGTHLGITGDQPAGVGDGPAQPCQRHSGAGTGPILSRSAAIPAGMACEFRVGCPGTASRAPSGRRANRRASGTSGTGRGRSRAGMPLAYGTGHTGTVRSAFILRLSNGADNVTARRVREAPHARAGGRGRAADGRHDRQGAAAAGDGRRRLLRRGSGAGARGRAPLRRGDPRPGPAEGARRRGLPADRRDGRRKPGC